MKTPATRTGQTISIPPDILREIESFEDEAAKVLSGELSQDLFRPFRLQHGIYGQRQPGVQMVRIKIPFGGLNSTQLRVIAEMAERYTTGVGHVTTRQDIQLHFAALEHVGTIMRRLAEVGVTTREACGNTVRNVTACHLAGVCQGEIFDVTPYAKAVSQHLLRNPLNQSLPRKFKIALSGCRHDCAMTPIHDLGFLAVTRSDGEIGFRVTAGGGLGSTPRLAQVLREFLPMEDLLPLCDSVIKVFDNLGNRKNRNKARMEFVNGNLRTTIQQNLCIRWVPNDRIEPLYQRLREANLGDPGAELVEDIIACPGTDTCGLGITSSKGVARALAEIFPAGNVPEDLRDVSVKISGCHNSCAQHHIATIGLHGVGKRMGAHVAPHYELHLGGRVTGQPQIGPMTGKLPAKDGPAALSHRLAVWRRDRQDGESLLAFIDRTGKAKLKEELIPFTILPPFEEDSSYYYDWEADEEFVMEDLGPGECAGGALEMIENRILEAEQELYVARLLAEKDQHATAVNKAYRAVLAAAKAVLVPEGIDPNTDAETFVEFERRFGATGMIAAEYPTPSAKIGDLGPKETTASFAAEKLRYAKGFVEACKTMSEELGQKLKANETKPDQATQTSAPVSPVAVTKPVATLDLRGVMCPINYVKTKLKLEMMEPGEVLEVWLDAGEPIKNVPQSLRNDGQNVVSEVPAESYYKVTVEKVV